MDSITRPTAETPTSETPTSESLAAESLAALAVDLVARATAAPHGLLFIDATGDRLDDLATAARALDPGLSVLAFPAWDSLPYDRTPPTAAIVGRRVAALAHLAAEPGRTRLVLTSARAVLARVPPPAHWAGAELAFAPDDDVDLADIAERLHSFGYTDDEHVDEAGQVAVRAHVIDIFPGDAMVPHRLLIADGRLQAIHCVDPSSQRSEAASEARLLVRPVTEATGGETQALVCVLEYLAGATILLHAEAGTRWDELREQIADAHAALARARRTAAGGDGAAYLPPPAELFTGAEELATLLAGATEEPLFGRATPTAALHRPAAVAAAIRDALATGRVVVAAGTGAARLHGVLSRRGGFPVRLATDWQDATSGPADTAAILPLAVATGFVRGGVHLIAATAVQPRTRSADRLILEEPLRIGDIVVHRGHGVCRLRGLARVGEEERVALEFANDTELLVPTDELDQLWRYGSEPGAIGLDRVDGEAWRRREAEIAGEIVATAKGLAAEAAARASLQAPAIQPPAAPYARFVRRFEHPLSPDQADAIDECLADLASGRPMDRLVCGDVGFGKTEVALRAAASVALAGYQVAVVAPTTVLARQHFDTFTRRFAGLGVRVGQLLRGATTAEGRATQAGLADGSIGVVVGTQAIAGDAIRFKNLALVVIDEEQRFGDAQKKRLTALRNPEGGVHALAMTATPIPRTLQAAMVGLRAVSVIATAPVRRQPTRTFVLPWEPGGRARGPAARACAAAAKASSSAPGSRTPRRWPRAWPRSPPNSPSSPPMAA